MPVKKAVKKAASPRKVRETSAGKGGVKYARLTLLMESGQTLMKLSKELQEFARDGFNDGYGAVVRWVVEGKTITAAEFDAAFGGK